MKQLDYLCYFLLHSPITLHSSFKARDEVYRYRVQVHVSIHSPKVALKPAPIPHQTILCFLRSEDLTAVNHFFP